MRRRQFAQAQAAAYAPPVADDVGAFKKRLATLTELALKGGYCPACETHLGRGVRLHYKHCGAVNERPRHDDRADSRRS